LRIIITCDHGGNTIPSEYASLFKGAKGVLHSHQGYDLGALSLARKVEKSISGKLFYTTISRLLIDCNRSLHNRSLLSGYTKGKTAKKPLINIYKSYRNPVEKEINKAMQKEELVIHLAIHSFTPKLHGVTRKCDIGFLYDPKRPLEKKFSAVAAEKIRKNSNLHVRYNYPYQGKSDGFPTYLRKKFTGSNYIGIEVEVNQKFVTSSGNVAPNVVTALIQGLQDAVTKIIK
jgi:predicted N-formylglutamate amidohydrolase